MDTKFVKKYLSAGKFAWCLPGQSTERDAVTSEYGHTSSNRCSGGVTQLIMRRASNRKVVKPWFDCRCSSALLYPSGQAVYPSWWPSLTKTANGTFRYLVVSRFRTIWITREKERTLYKLIQTLCVSGMKTCSIFILYGLSWTSLKTFWNQILT